MLMEERVTQIFPISEREIADLQLSDGGEGEGRDSFEEGSRGIRGSRD